MTALLISDLHLAPERPAVSEAFFDFLDRHAAGADSLYILGDFFEVWIGDDDPAPLALRLTSALRKLTERGVEVYFLHGNRDFLVGRRFARATGCTLLPDYYVATLAGTRVLLCHGDTLCTDDQDYQRYRRRIRSPVARWLLARLPLKTRQRLARGLRNRSRTNNSNKPDNIMDVSPQEVDRVLDKYDADLMIHGHTHRPGRHCHHNGERIVLGDWLENGWYVRADHRGFELISFPIPDSP